MITCPLCEHAQPAGDECEVCGKRFAVVRPTAMVPALEGLEPTRLGDVGEVPTARLEAFEPTHLEEVAAAAAPLEGIERTGVDPVVVASEPVAGLEPTLADPVPGAASDPAPVVCRYCRTPAPDGEALCGRCGMRLPIARPLAAEPIATRCPACGSAVTGGRCAQCGGPARISAG